MKGIPMEHEGEVVAALEKRFEELIRNEDAWSIVAVDAETGTIVKRAPSDNVLIRIQTIMPFPAHAVMAYLRRFEERPKWDATCEQFKVVMASDSKDDHNIRYFYYRSYGKWMVSPRDGYMLVAEKIISNMNKAVDDGSGVGIDLNKSGSGGGTWADHSNRSCPSPASNPLDSAIYRIVSCSAPDTPLHDGCIRMDNYLSATAVIPVTKGPATSSSFPENHSHSGSRSCTQLIQICDWSLNGYIPNWLVHRLLTHYIPQSVKQLMEQISKSNDHCHDVDADSQMD